MSSVNKWKTQYAIQTSSKLNAIVTVDNCIQVFSSVLQNFRCTTYLLTLVS